MDEPTSPAERDPQGDPTIRSDRADELMARWEQAYHAGRNLSPFELCPDDESLRDELFRRITAFKQSQQQPPEGAKSDQPTQPTGPGQTSGQTAPAAGFVAGRFQALEHFRSGGLGYVFVARDEELDRIVALKTTKRPLAEGSLDERRFDREARITALLEHPGVVPVYGYGKLGEGRRKQPYYAMRLVKGRTLSDAIDEAHGISSPESSEAGPHPKTTGAAKHVAFQKLLRAFLTVCETVAFSHEQHGVVHRDIKPINVILGNYGEVFLLDWGLAKQLGVTEADADAPRDPSSMTTGDRMQEMMSSPGGTLSYMSPEQAETFLEYCRDPDANPSDSDTRVGGASDIFSLGATLFQILTGKPPVEKGADPVETAQRLVNGHIPQPRTIKPDVPKALAAVCRKAMSANPSDRYATARELADDIACWLADEPVSAWTEPWTLRARRWVRNHRTLVASAVVLAAMAFIALGGLAIVQHQHNRSLQRFAEREQQANRWARLQAYAAHMNLVQKAWDAGDIQRVNNLLARHTPEPGHTDLRGFEWYYYKRLAGSDPFPIVELETPIRSFAISPDGQILATGDNHGHVALWDADVNQRHFGRDLQDGPVTALAFSPDGRHLLTAGHNRLTVWRITQADSKVQLQESQEITTSQKGSPVGAFSPEGRWLATARSDGIILLHSRDSSAKAGKNAGKAGGLRPVGRLNHGAEVTDLAFSPNARRMASTATDGTVCVWNLAGNVLERKLNSHRGVATSVAFSRDSRLIASGGRDGTVHIWDVIKDEPKEVLSLRMAPVTDVAFSPNGPFLAASMDNKTTRLWELVPSGDSEDFIERVTLTGHGAAVSRVAFFPQRDLLATASEDGKVRLWNSLTGKAVIAHNDLDPRFGGHGGYVFSVAISPDKRYLATASGDLKVSMWDLRAQQRLPQFEKQAHEETIYWVEFSPDGNILASCSTSGRVKLWDPQTGALQKTFGSREQPGVWYIDFSPDGRFLAGGRTDGSVIVWDVNTGRHKTMPNRHAGELWSVAFSPDGKLLASGAEDMAIKLWDVAEEKEIATLKGHQGIVTCVRFSPDGKLLASSSNDGTIKLWDVETRKPINTLTGHASMIFNLDFSPKGKTLASASWDHTVKLWNLATGLEVATLTGHTATVYSVEFSRDGKLLASGSKDRTAILWRADDVPLVKSPEQRSVSQTTE